MKIKSGISLIILVITIIVMVILASVVVIGIVNSDVLNRSNNAKEATQIAQEKHIIAEAYVIAKGSAKNGVTKSLNEELSKHNAYVEDATENIIIKFNESKRYYEINKQGQVENIEVETLNKLTIQCVNSVGTVLGEKQQIIFQKEYAVEPLKIEGYECAIEKITGTATENKTIKQLYYKIFDDDETLVFTGLNSDGAVTTTESEIVSYMVGDGSSTMGNGIKEKTIQGVLKIPDTYKEKKVTTINHNAFYNVQNTVKIQIGDNVEKILGYAFCGSSKAIEVTLGRNLNSVEGHAFWNCYSLKTLILKSDIMNTSWFNGSRNWTQIKVDEENKVFKEENNILYTKDGLTLVSVPIAIQGDFVIPKTVEIVASGAFSNSRLKNVVITDNVTTLSTSSFQGMGLLESLTIGKGLTNLGTTTFYNCPNLKKVIINNSTFSSGLFGACKSWTEIEVGENNPTFMERNNLLYLKDGETLVAVPIGITGTLILPEGTKTISGSSFGSSLITSVVIPESTETIGTYVFWAAGQLSEITIGKSVKSIGQHSFTTTSKLVTVVIDSPIIAKGLTSQTAQANLINKAKTIYIHKDVTQIASFIETAYTKQKTSDRQNYIMYVKNE